MINQPSARVNHLDLLSLLPYTSLQPVIDSATLNDAGVHLNERRHKMGQDLIKIFEYALNQEKTGMSFFEMSLQRMGIGAAITAFKKIVEEEKSHVRFIEAILRNLKDEQDVNFSQLEGLVLAPTDYFDTRAKSEFLERCVYESMIPDVTVFNTAWLIEKDLSEFYQGVAEEVRGPAAEALKMLAAWEKAHERFFREYRDKLTETYSKMPWGG
jgi:rubrerythrin